MSKVSIIGAGAVGSLVAFNLTSKNLSDVILVDIIKGKAQGKALDISQSLPIFNSNSKIIGTSEYSETKNSDIVIITAGFPRKSSMTRDDLCEVNSKILTSIIPNIIKESPDCILLIVTNPLTAMTQLAYNLSGFSKQKVLGMAGVLDSSRFKFFLSEKIEIKNSEIKTFVLGDHGDLMVPLISSCKIDDKNLDDFLSKNDIDFVISKVRNAGGEIISLLKNESTSFAPAACIFEMVESILKNKSKILPCTVLLEGEYGIDNLFVGVPVKLGKNGVEEIVIFDLSNEEKIQLNNSVNHIKKLIKKI